MRAQHSGIAAAVVIGLIVVNVRPAAAQRDEKLRGQGTALVTVNSRPSETNGVRMMSDVQARRDETGAVTGAMNIKPDGSVPITVSGSPMALRAVRSERVDAFRVAYDTGVYEISGAATLEAID